MPTLDDSVADFIRGLKAGDQDAAGELWRRYYERLVRLCKGRLATDLRGAADEEDIALSVLKSLCLGAERGRFDQLVGRDDLWRLLLTITRRKLVDHIRRQRAAKRDVRRTRGESSSDSVAAGAVGIGGIPDSTASPDLLAILQEESQRLLLLLRDETLRKIAVWRMEGRSNQEIASELCVTERTVERKLRLIREQWSGR